MGNLFAKMLATFYSKNIEVVLVGLENSGKTTLVNVLASGHPMETCPTIGLNVKVVKRGGVTMKCWDIGGQEQYRSEVTFQELATRAKWEEEQAAFTAASQRQDAIFQHELMQTVAIQSAS